jgi:hypothetical protein
MQIETIDRVTHFEPLSLFIQSLPKDGLHVLVVFRVRIQWMRRATTSTDAWLEFSHARSAIVRQLHVLLAMAQARIDRCNQFISESKIHFTYPDLPQDFLLCNHSTRFGIIHVLNRFVLVAGH